MFPSFACYSKNFLASQIAKGYISVMVATSIKVDTTSMAGIIDIPKQIRFAQKKALYKTAEQARRNVQDVMKKTIDRPKPYTLNSVGVFQPPNFDSQSGTKSGVAVAIKDVYKGGDNAIPGAYFMATNVHIRARVHKRFEKALIAAGVMQPNEYAIPTDAIKKDAYGNPSTGVIVKILAYFQAFPPNSRRKNVNLAVLKTARRDFRYFAGESPDGSYRGIFEARLFAFGEGVSVRPIFIFQSRQPRYRKRVPFHEVVESAMKTYYDKYFDEEFAKAIATARRI